MARGANDRASGSSWLGQVNDLTQGLSRASAAQTLYELAWRYQRSGQWDAAAEAYQVVVDRYGEEEIADAAALWLVQFYASSEASALWTRLIAPTIRWGGIVPPGPRARWLWEIPTARR